MQLQNWRHEKESPDYGDDWQIASGFTEDRGAAAAQQPFDSLIFRGTIENHQISWWPF